MNRRLSISLALVVILTALLCGCGGGGGSTPPPPPPPRSNPAPVLTWLHPSTVTAGAAAFDLIVNGDGFVSGASVHWNGTARSTTFSSSTVVTAHITAADVAQALTAKITVTNPGSSASNSFDFVIAPAAKTIALPANHLIYDAGRQRIYASIPSRAGAPSANSVAVIDPSTGTIATSIQVGEEPNVLALSQDGRYLYVGLDGAGAVRRIDLNTQAPDQQFSLGNDSATNAFHAVDIAAAPGSPQTIAVVRRTQYGNKNTAIYDNGVPRPTTASVGDRIEFSNSSSTLYSYDSETSSFGFYRLKVDANGVSTSDINGNLITSYGADIVYDGGLIFATSGNVVNPADDSPAGNFLMSSQQAASVVPDSTAGKVYFLFGDYNGQSSIVAYDKNTQLRTGALNFSTAPGTPASNLVQWGAGRFAVTAADKIVILTDPLTPDPQTALTLDQLPVNHIVYDATRQKIYASVPGRAGQQGNSVAVVDPTTQKIDQTIFVGSEPDSLALSRDGSTLYVALNGSARIRKVDLATRTAGLQFAVGATSNAPLYADDIAVAPGSPNTIAVSRRFGVWAVSRAGVAIYDDGVQRPTITSGNDDSTRIEFGDSDSVLYGQNTATSEQGFRRMKVEATGVTTTDSTPRLLSATDLVYDGGWVYGNDGRVVDPRVPAMLGAVSSSASFLSLAPDVASGRIYAMTSDAATKIVAFDSSTFVPIGSFSLTQYVNEARDLVRCGSAGFAFVNAQLGRLVVVNGSFTPPPAINGIDKLPVNHLVYDASRQKIYASVPSRAGQRGNSITIIDPATSAIESSIYIGSEPNVMALSKDGRYLYAGLDGVRAIRRLDLTTRTPGLQFSLGTDPSYGPLLAGDISVSPDNSDVLAIARRYGSYGNYGSAGIAIFDQGVQRPATTNATFTSTDKIEFSDSGSTLYGYNSQGSDFRRMKVDSTGVSIIDTISNLIYGNVDILFHGGLIFTNDGTLLDPSTKTLLGSYSPGYSVSVADDVDNNRVYFLSTASYQSPTILGYDRARYTQIGSSSFAGVTGTPFDLLHWGTSGFAFATSNDRVVISSSPFVPPATPGLDQLRVNHLAYDSSRDRIYASVQGSNNGTLGNSIAVIDPHTSRILASIFVGSEPNVLALSRDNAYLYVGLDGLGAVRRVDLATGTAGPQFGLGYDSTFGPMFAEDIAVMPGTPTTVAVSRRYKYVSPRHAGVAVYDNGVRRTNVTPSHTGSNEIEFSDSPSTLYGYNNETSEYGFRRMNVDANGVSVTDVNTTLIAGSSSIAYDSGLIYATSGAVVNPVTNTLVTRIGNGYGVKVLPDASLNRIYFLNSLAGATVSGYDKTTFASLGSVTIPGASGSARDFVRWGASGLAVATDAQVIITSGLLPEPRALEIVTSVLPPTMPAKAYDLTLSTVGGKSPTTWALTSGTLPPGLTISPQGRIAGTVGNVTAQSYDFTVQVSDSATPPATAAKTLSIAVKTSLGSNNTCNGATPLSFSRISASLSPYGDIDVYQFDGEAGSTITAETIAHRLQLDTNSSTVDSYADTVLELLDSSCSPIAMNDDLSANELDSRIAGFNLPYTGKYYVRVTDSRGDGRPDLLYDLVLKKE